MIKFDYSWKIWIISQLILTIKFISSKDTDDTDDTMTYDEADEVIEKLSESLLCRYQISLKPTMKGMTLLLIVLIYCDISAIQ